MNDQKSETPRTDAARIKITFDDGESVTTEVVYFEDMVKLERELTAAKQSAEFHSDQCDKLQKDNERMESRIQQLDEETFQLREELKLANQSLAESQIKIAHLEDNLNHIQTQRSNWEKRATELQVMLNESQKDKQSCVKGHKFIANSHEYVCPTCELEKSQAREAGLREALENVQNSSVDCKCKWYGGICQCYTDYIDKALTAPPTSVVPWEVVAEFMDAREHFEKLPFPVSGGVFDAAETRLNKARKAIQSYAPQPKEKV